jgi:prephenate dehydratase
MAAEALRNGKLGDALVIASPEAAEAYDLHVVDGDMGDAPRGINLTRMAIVSRSERWTG